jgi:HSP20 family protein
MPITRYNPFFAEFPFRAFEDTLARLMTTPATVATTASAGDGGAKPWVPAVDIRETEHALILKADLPEIDEKDIDLRIEDGTMVPKGERKFEKEENNGGGGYHRIERSYGSFARYFSLPDTVDADNVKAEYKAGVLTITLAKKEAAKPKQIKVAIQ